MAYSFCQQKFAKKCAPPFKDGFRFSVFGNQLPGVRRGLGSSFFTSQGGRVAYTGETPVPPETPENVLLPASGCQDLLPKTKNRKWETVF